MDEDWTAQEYLEQALREEEVLRALDTTDPYRPLARANIEFYLDGAAKAEKAAER
jgi:hypothetical protein